ncbi:hypothetical protein HPP92_001092 [Vanilla planifolia]|uniref:Uncharacterized protein n=1 Tax=Vanilla planifolia TaxID=51239 RepID=A0A835RQF6_VANPL|nr:hypothetical protein HPP92_001092 [Vanilla planifolia]
MEGKHERRSKAIAESVDTSTPPHLHPTSILCQIMEDKEKVNGDMDNDYSRPRSFLGENPRKRLCFSMPSVSSLPPKPQDSADPLACHSCNTTDVDLRILDSQWRVVFLCCGCLYRVHSGFICSYCFTCFNALVDIDVLSCCGCKCRIHLKCVPLQRGYITLSEINPASFICIDCCAIPRLQFRNPTVTRALSEDFLRIASSAAKKKTAFAARAREKALKKADEARLAMERAFDAILFARDAAVSDEKLALQLHLVMNGSPRILGGASMANIDHEISSKKDFGDLKGKQKLKKQRKRNERVNEQGGLCTKGDAFSQSKDILLSKENCFVEVAISVGKEFAKFDADCASGSFELALHERKDSHLDLVVNSYGDTKNDGAFISLRESADSNSFMEVSVCGRGGEGFQELQEEKRCAVGDRCAIKYFKRKSRSKGLIAATKLTVQSSHSDVSTFADCRSTSIQGHLFPTSSGSVS